MTERSTTETQQAVRAEPREPNITYVLNGPVYGTSEQELARHLAQHTQRARDEAANRDSSRTG